MLDSPFLWFLAVRVPALFPGPTLHRAGLHAALAGASRTADTLLEKAAERYRLELEVEALARLRIHQLVIRARATTDPGREAELLLEAAQRLARVERIESFDPPFPMIPGNALFETGHAPKARSGFRDAA